MGLKSGTFTAGHAGFKAPLAKVVKYGKACIENQHTFIPFGFDTLCFLALGAVELLKKVQKVTSVNVMIPRFMDVVFKRIGFANSKRVELEQYPTGPHIASRLLYMAENTFDDISCKIVADFGCGCGTLGIASALLGAEHVIGVDVDPQSLEIASKNAADMEVDIDLVEGDVRSIRWKGQLFSEQIADTVVMNPPFGTRKKGADMDFVSIALKVASRAVYSLHKTSTREHVRRAALRDFNAKHAEVLCELRFDVPQLYKFHKKKEVDIAVDLWRFVPQSPL